MPPLPGSRRDFYWYNILDFFLFVLLTLRIEPRALPLRSDERTEQVLCHWVTTQCLFFFFPPHFHSETGSPSIVLAVFQLTVSEWDSNFESSSRVTEFLFRSGHILDFKDNPGILQTSLCLSLLDIFFFLSPPSLYFLRQSCFVTQAGLHIIILLLQLLLKWQGTGMGVMFEKIKQHKITGVYLGTLLHLYLICKFQKDATLQKWFIETGYPTLPMCTHGI